MLVTLLKQCRTDKTKIYSDLHYVILHQPFLFESKRQQERRQACMRGACSASQATWLLNTTLLKPLLDPIRQKGQQSRMISQFMMRIHSNVTTQT